NTTTDICCAASDSDCCETSAAAAEFALTIILVVMITCCCCCVAITRFTAQRHRRPPPTSRVGRIAYFLGLWPTYDPDVPIPMPNTLGRDATTLENVVAPRFIFPDLEPLEVSQERDCIVCFAVSRNTVLPCGHSVVCESCCKELVERRKPCPTC